MSKENYIKLSQTHSHSKKKLHSPVNKFPRVANIGSLRICLFRPHPYFFLKSGLRRLNLIVLTVRVQEERKCPSPRQPRPNNAQCETSVTLQPSCTRERVNGILNYLHKHFSDKINLLEDQGQLFRKCVRFFLHEILVRSSRIAITCTLKNQNRFRGLCNSIPVR